MLVYPIADLEPPHQGEDSVACQIGRMKDEPKILVLDRRKEPKGSTPCSEQPLPRSHSQEPSIIGPRGGTRNRTNVDGRRNRSSKTMASPFRPEAGHQWVCHGLGLCGVQGSLFFLSNQSNQRRLSKEWRDVATIAINGEPVQSDRCAAQSPGPRDASRLSDKEISACRNDALAEAGGNRTGFRRLL